MKTSTNTDPIIIAVFLYFLGTTLKAGPDEEFILQSQQTLKSEEVTGSDKLLLVQKLERLKTDAAIALLKKELISVPAPVSKDMSITGDFPCAKALIRIGKPSIEPMVDTILHTTNVKERVMAAYVISGIVGTEEARSLLRARAWSRMLTPVSLNSPTAVARLKEALRALESDVVAVVMIAKSEGRFTGEE
jgi:hypothetical protein